MKAFVYCRQSVTTDQEDSLSIKVQEDECLKFAVARSIEVIEIFKEQDISGRLYPSSFEALAAIDTTYVKWCVETRKTGQFREELGKMLKRLNEVECVICLDITRLHRSLSGSFLENLIIQQFSVNKVKILTVKEGEIDFGKFQDSLMMMLTTQINSSQLTMQREKVKSALKRLKDSGEWSCALTKSFGYKSNGKKREVEIVDFKAEIVKGIYKRYAEGWSYHRIIKEFGPTCYERTGKSINVTMIRRILHNPVYCGYVHDSSGNLIKAKQLIGKEIIDFDEWKKTQEIINDHKRYPVRAKKTWLPLSGRIFCGKCGGTMFARPTHDGRNIYRCDQYMRKGYDSSHSCKIGLIWNGKPPKIQPGCFMDESLKGLLPLYYMNALEHSQMSVDEEEEKLHIELLNLEQRMSTITQNFMDGLLDETVYYKTLKTSKAKTKEINLRLDEIRSAKKGSYDVMSMIRDVTKMHLCENEELTEALRWVVKKLLIFKTHILIETPVGEIELPIRRGFRANELPKNSVLVKEDQVEVTYYFGALNEDGEKREILKHGKVRINIQD